jgi:hypothetical protein
MMPICGFEQTMEGLENIVFAAAFGMLSAVPVPDDASHCSWLLRLKVPCSKTENRI